jgi:hypothetical protein
VILQGFVGVKDLVREITLEDCEVYEGLAIHFSMEMIKNTEKGF